MPNMCVFGQSHSVKKIEPSAYSANFSKIDDQVARLILWSEQRRSACANRIHKDNPWFTVVAPVFLAYEFWSIHRSLPTPFPFFTSTWLVGWWSRRDHISQWVLPRLLSVRFLYGLYVGKCVLGPYRQPGPCALGTSSSGYWPYAIFRRTLQSICTI